MKNPLIVGLILLTGITSACQKEIELPEVLVTATSRITVAFENLDQQLEAAAAYLVSVDMDTSLIRARLAELVVSNPSVGGFSWITPEGILKIIEPMSGYSSQGVDISGQDHIIRCFATRQPVLSSSFTLVEGFQAAIDIHPIMDNGILLGGVDAVIRTGEFLGTVIGPLLEGDVEFELWVVEKGGTMIYDQDAYVIGLNLFTDPLYQDFPDLLTAAEKINDEKTGTTHYSFYKALTNETVTKLAYWTTVEHHGMEWKIVWVKPE